MTVFRFKHFNVLQNSSAMKVGTDAMVFGSFIDVENKFCALDIGTGTGVLSLMCAQKNSQLKITAIEIEKNAFEEAKLNFSNSKFCSQLTVLNEDFLIFNSTKKYDLIFSNPPYFENSYQSVNILRNITRHTDSLPFNEFILKVGQLLSINGDFYIIIPINSCEKIIQYCLKTQLFLKKKLNIFGKTNHLIRVILVFSKINQKLTEFDFIIRDEFGKYTNEYKDLTKEYHGKEL
jgi:tRNA1Val (adenine37-N6)-methyltransferase